MRIAIDASRCVAPAPTGTEHYSRRLIQALIVANETHPKPHRIRLYFRDRPPPDLLPPSDFVEQLVIPMPRLWTHIRFALELWKTRPDITFVPAHSLPFLFPGSAIVTVHDLGFKHFPAAHPLTQRAYLELTTRFSQSRAKIVLADSEATKADLRHFYQTPSHKIRVVHPGVDAPVIGDIRAARAKYSLPPRYFLFLGTLQPRKNIKRLVNAFGRWQRQQPDRETALVLAGGKGWLFDPDWLAGAEHVKLLGYIDEADKGALLAGALALTFPSLHEGFGFPVIEAMHCGAPVIASNTSSLPELVGDAGILVDPADSSAICDAMTQLAADETLRQKLIQRGRIQARQFTWSSAARDLLDAFDEIAAHA